MQQQQQCVITISSTAGSVRINCLCFLELLSLCLVINWGDMTWHQCSCTSRDTVEMLFWSAAKPPAHKVLKSKRAPLRWQTGGTVLDLSQAGGLLASWPPCNLPAGHEREATMWNATHTHAHAHTLIDCWACWQKRMCTLMIDKTPACLRDDTKPIGIVHRWTQPLHTAWLFRTQPAARECISHPAPSSPLRKIDANDTREQSLPCGVSPTSAPVHFYSLNLNSTFLYGGPFVTLRCHWRNQAGRGQ